MHRLAIDTAAQSGKYMDEARSVQGVDPDLPARPDHRHQRPHRFVAPRERLRHAKAESTVEGCGPKREVTDIGNGVSNGLGTTPFCLQECRERIVGTDHTDAMLAEDATICAGTTTGIEPGAPIRRCCPKAYESADARVEPGRAPSRDAGVIVSIFSELLEPNTPGVFEVLAPGCVGWGARVAAAFVLFGHVGRCRQLLPCALEDQDN
jgi:hypothetical protein